jgi:hypothetical protein
MICRNGFQVGREYCGFLTAAIFASSALKWTLNASCSDRKPYACESGLGKFAGNGALFEGLLQFSNPSDFNQVLSPSDFNRVLNP